MDSIQFGKRNYRIREVEMEDAGIRIIASTYLNKRLVTEEGSYTSKEAGYIDEQIYFFVEPGKLKLSDQALNNYVIKNCIWKQFYIFRQSSECFTSIESSLLNLL